MNTYNPYRGEFTNIEDLAHQFATDSVRDYEILFAGYDTPPYEGYAYVLCRKDGELFEVEASHCSCMGLENQFEPKHITKAYLKQRIEKGSFAYGSFKNDEIAEAMREAGIESGE